jgi:hypothetical protein
MVAVYLGFFFYVIFAIIKLKISRFIEFLVMVITSYTGVKLVHIFISLGERAILPSSIVAGVIFGIIFGVALTFLFVKYVCTVKIEKLVIGGMASGMASLATSIVSVYAFCHALSYQRIFYSFLVAVAASLIAPMFGFLIECFYKFFFKNVPQPIYERLARICTSCVSSCITSNMVMFIFMGYASLSIAAYGVSAGIVAGTVIMKILRFE